MKINNPVLNIQINNNNCNISGNNALFIEGGGTKGVSAIGVLQCLMTYNNFFNIQNVKIFGGTSVGSYLALALALGYTPDDFNNFVDNLKLEKLIDPPYLFIFSVSRLLYYNYLYNDYGRIEIIKLIIKIKFDDIVKDLIESGIILNANFSPELLTFGDLIKLKNYKPNIYKDLIINTVDISRNEQIFMTTLEPDLWSDIKIMDALLASSAIPFVFKSQEFYYDISNNKYTKNKSENCLSCTFIDGGVSTNNPLDYFLINRELYKDYNLFLIKFSVEKSYIFINNLFSLTSRLLEYLITGKNDIKTDMIEKEHCVNSIIIELTSGTLDIYTKNEIQNIIKSCFSKFMLQMKNLQSTLN